MGPASPVLQALCPHSVYFEFLPLAPDGYPTSWVSQTGCVAHASCLTPRQISKALLLITGSHVWIQFCLPLSFIAAAAASSNHLLNYYYYYTQTRSVISQSGHFAAWASNLLTPMSKQKSSLEFEGFACVQRPRIRLPLIVIVCSTNVKGSGLPHRHLQVYQLDSQLCSSSIGFFFHSVM